MAYPVVQWRRFVKGGTDSDGYRTKDHFADPITIRADFAPEQVVEPRDGTTVRQVSEAQLILDTPIDYGAKDRFIVDGREYQAEGVNPPWYGRYSRRLFGQQIMLRGTDGRQAGAEQGRSA